MFLKSLIVFPFVFVMICNFKHALFSSPAIQSEILDREKVIQNEKHVMKSKVLQFINEGLNKGNIELLDGLLSKQFEGRYCDRTSTQCIVKEFNHNQLKQIIENTHTNSPDYHLDIENMQVGNKTVTVHWEGGISEKGLPIRFLKGESDYTEKMRQKGILKLTFKNGFIQSYRIWDYVEKRSNHNSSVNGIITIFLRGS